MYNNMNGFTNYGTSSRALIDIQVTSMNLTLKSPINNGLNNSY